MKLAGVARCGLGLICAAAVMSCSSHSEQVKRAIVPAKENEVTPMEKSLLEMSYAEAVAISPQHLEWPPFYKITADTIKVVKKDAAGQPLKVEARGHVFVELTMDYFASGICDSAVLTADVAKLSGKPLIMRSNRVARGVSEDSVFVIAKESLKLQGKYQLARLPDAPMSVQSLAMNFPTPEPMLPPVTDPWMATSENVLLPSLEMSKPRVEAQ